MFKRGMPGDAKGVFEMTRLGSGASYTDTTATLFPSAARFAYAIGLRNKRRGWG